MMYYDECCTVDNQAVKMEHGPRTVGRRVGQAKKEKRKFKKEAGNRNDGALVSKGRHESGRQAGRRLCIFLYLYGVAPALRTADMTCCYY